jgi:hypothetical protein
MESRQEVADAIIKGTKMRMRAICKRLAELETERSHEALRERAILTVELFDKESTLVIMNNSLKGE